MSGEKGQSHLKVNMAVGQPIGTSFIQEVNIFDQQTEEGNHNLTRENRQEDIGNIDVTVKRNLFQRAVRETAAMQSRVVPFLCCCWQSENDGRPPSGQSCSCKSCL